MSELDFSLRPVWKPEAFANGAKVVESAATETSAPDESSALGDTSLVDSWPTGPFVYEKEWLLKFQAEHKARPAQLGDSPVVSSPEEQERLRAAVLQQQSEREKHFEQQKQNNKIRPQLKQRGPKRNANNEDTPTLVKGEDRWMPSAQDKKKHTKTLEQQFTSLLNKLTLENFTILTRQMVELARDVASRAQLTALVQLVFEQAISEQKFSTMYAQLCAILAVHVPFFESEQSGAKLSFRSELLNTCQQFFQDEHIDDMADYLKAQHPDADKTELQEAEVKYRARIMGNVKFIGELYKLNVLSSKILLRYIVTPLLHISLGKTDDSQEVQEMALEKLAKLFMSSGQAIESRSPEQMQEYLTHMQELSSSSQSPRLRFLLLDLLELQKNAWVARRKAEAPQRIGALHAAAGDADYDHHLPADVLTNMAQLAASLPKPSGPPRRDAPVDGWRRCVPGGGSADGATNSTGAGNSSSSTASTSNGGSARRVSFAAPTKSLEDRVAGMVEELLTSHDVDEALLQYKELGPSSDGGEYVRLAFHEVATALNANVDILTKFFKALPSDALRTGHAAFSKELDDVKIDNPNCTKTLTPLFKNLKL